MNRNLITSSKNGVKTLFLRGLICVSYIKTAVKNVKYHRGVPCTPLMINQGVGKKSGGWEAQGGPSHPPNFDRGVAPPPWTPLETASVYRNE